MYHNINANATVTFSNIQSIAWGGGVRTNQPTSLPPPWLRAWTLWNYVVTVILSFVSVSDNMKLARQFYEFSADY